MHKYNSRVMTRMHAVYKSNWQYTNSICILPISYWQYTDLFIFRFVSLLCLRSTLRLFHFWIFHFWIFHRCDPMPNLKKFCHSLRHEMVSHLFPFLTSISKLALRLFDLIFSKTRFSSHITFISRCLFRTSTSFTDNL